MPVTTFVELVVFVTPTVMAQLLVFSDAVTDTSDRLVIVAADVETPVTTT
jgi:hypothetical protein